jgi:hypothetical protein
VVITDATLVTGTKIQAPGARVDVPASVTIGEAVELAKDGVQRRVVAASSTGRGPVLMARIAMV